MSRILIAALLLHSACLAADVPAPLPPISDFVRPVRTAAVDLSPDGKYLATLTDVSGITVLRIVDLAAKTEFVVKAAKEGSIKDFDWVSDKRLVYSIGQHVGGLEREISTGELLGIDAEGGGNQYLFGYRGKDSVGTRIQRHTAEDASATVIDTLVDDDRHIVIQTNSWNSDAHGIPEAWKLDVDSGEKQKIARAPAPQSRMITDFKGNVRLAIADNKDGVNIDLYERDVESGDWHQLVDGAKQQLALRPIAFTADNEHFYAYSSAPEGPDGIVLFDIKKLDFELISRHEWVDPQNPQFSRAAPGNLLAVNFQPGTAQLDPVESKGVEAQGLASFVKSFPGEQVQLVSSTRDASKLVYLISSDRRAGDFMLFDTQTKKASLVASRRPWFKPEQLQPKSAIEFKTRDGLTLHGYLTRGRGLAADAAAPLVVLPHGGPFYAHDGFDYDGEVQLLANRGYSVLQVNFRGSGGYGSALVEAGQKGWGTAMQDDLTDATKWAIEHGHADKDRICIYGVSYGGYAALMGAAREPDLYRCAIGYAGVYDLEQMFKRGDVDDSSFGIAYLKNMVGDDTEKLRAISPARQAGKIKAKVMLIAGGSDLRAPPAHSEAMRKALKEAGNDPEWLYKANEGHGFVDEKNKEELYTKLLEFLDRNLGVKAGG